MLLKPYVALLHETDSLRNLEKVRGDKGCTGCPNGQSLEVSCILFNSMWLITTLSLVDN